MSWLAPQQAQDMISKLGTSEIMHMPGLAIADTEQPCFSIGLIWRCLRFKIMLPASSALNHGLMLLTSCLESTFCTNAADAVHIRCIRIGKVQSMSTGFAMCTDHGKSQHSRICSLSNTFCWTSKSLSESEVVIHLMSERLQMHSKLRCAMMWQSHASNDQLLNRPSHLAQIWQHDAWTCHDDSVCW